jgi:predicted regulator of amino acid metabolism with ACT domain
VSSIAPRITNLGNRVVSEIAERCGVDRTVVMRAMMTVSLHHQRELMETIDHLRDIPLEEF